jgi:signal transduction histidine kinase
MATAMGPAALVTASFALLACCAAVFDLWIYTQRPRERAYLWLAVAAAGVMWLAAGSSALYGATTLALAQEAQLLSLASALPIVIGFARFTEAYLEARPGPLLRIAPAYALAVVLLPTLDPALFFSGETVARRVEPFGQSYVFAELTPLAGLALAGFMPVFAEVIWSFAKDRRHGRDAFALAVALAVWSLCTANDIAIDFGLLPGVHLMAFGFLVFACLLTGLLLRRFVEASARVEASAEALQAEVDERTRRLRESDLAVAHGARMATVGALAGGLAHEINDPIAFVSSNLNHLAHTWRATDPSAFDEVLTETREGVERVRRVVSELLRLARRTEGPEVPVDLRRVIETILPIVRPESRWRARITTRLEPVPLVLGEDAMLGQVVLNLVVNALRAIPEGQPDAHEVCIETRFCEGAVTLRVRDDGPEIVPDVLPRLFDPFAPPRPEASGAELGLAVTHQLVARHRGRIDVETGSTGTTFTVYLPPADGEVQA